MSPRCTMPYALLSSQPVGGAGGLLHEVIVPPLRVQILRERSVVIYIKLSLITRSIGLLRKLKPPAGVGRKQLLIVPPDNVHCIIFVEPLFAINRVDNPYRAMPRGRRNPVPVFAAVGIEQEVNALLTILHWVMTLEPRFV